MPNHASTMLSHDAPFGVKWNWDLGMVGQPHLHRGHRLGGRVVEADAQLAAAVAAHNALQEAQEVSAGVPLRSRPGRGRS